MSSVLVIIVTFNGEEYIEKCLASICEPNLSLDIVVIDNNSTDRTLEIVESMSTKHITIIRNSNNLGFGKANNVGIKLGIDKDYDFVYLLNQDGYLTSGMIAKLIEVQLANINYGILSPLHLNNDGSLEKNFNRWLLNKTSFEGNLCDKKNELLECTFVNAAHWLISKEAVKTVGGFDPLFFVYGEDNNYIHRTLFHGFKIGIVTAARAYHDTADRKSKKLLEKRVRNFKLSIPLRLLNPLNSLKVAKKIVTMSYLMFVFQLLKNFKILSVFKTTIFLVKFYFKNIARIKTHRNIYRTEYYPFLNVSTSKSQSKQ